jgi:valyl-tRNA synthetase
MELPSQYNPKEVEEKIYRIWEESGYFNPNNLPKRHKKPYTIIMPPPNANGSLHLGHALTATTEDILIRFKRMQGFKTLWLPGADHAGFETQTVFEKKLEKEGTSRFEILNQPEGREKLYQMIWDFTQANKSHMENQTRKLGASCDWSREKFTLDPSIIKIVYQTFKKLYDDGLIYRANRIVNWCTKHQTALSDLEVNWEEKIDQLFYVKYFFIDNPNQYIMVATTRPETIPGDIAIAVNPKEKRYKQFIGKKVLEPITKRPIEVIADKDVDMSFGTGALKITPAHDATDFEIGQRHGLEIIKTLDLNGRFNKNAGPLEGMKVTEARAKAVDILNHNGNLEKVEDYKHQVAVCYKCRNIIEPMLLDQWFVKMTEPSISQKKSLRDLAIEAVKSGEVKFITKKFEKIFYHWMKNLKDWNISRQIVWGIRMPVWYKENADETGTIHIGEKPPEKTGWIQETDVFDTWFSSGQWPFAVLDYPDSKDFKIFYPTSVMETGWDILFFWVARMIIFGKYITEKAPFQHVYLHGLIRDKDRQKMSKSKNNAIDPLGVIDLYGTDALRMSLIVGNAPGNDPIISEEKIKGYRNFANKIWNASRFVLMNLQDFNSKNKIKPSAKDKTCLKTLDKLVSDVTKDMENFKLYHAAEKLYHYFWHNFADKIIEESKSRLQTEERANAQYLLLTILETTLKLLHPFMPFITEEIYQKLPGKEKSLLMIEEWPKI